VICGSFPPGKSAQFGTIGLAGAPGPALHTGHGGVATAGGAVGAGALIVVDGAAQFGTMVADAGPD